MAKKELNDRQKKFVLEYLRNGGNGQQAAISAGYSPRSAAVQASRMLNDDNVLAYKRTCARQVYNSIGITPAQIGIEAWGIYKKCMAAEPHLSWDSESHSYVPDGTFVFDSRGALKALEMLAKMEGIYKERVEVSGDPETVKAVMTLAQKQERLKELLHDSDDRR